MVNMELHDTNTKLKGEHWDTFAELIKDQWQYGGKKYEHTEEREVTDVIVDVFGMSWLFGTVVKYLLRFMNLHREKDLLKIACYMYITWLKCGFHEKKKHDTDTGGEK